MATCERCFVSRMVALERKAARIGPGAYRVHDLPFRIDGVWSIVVRARIDDFTQREFATTLTLP